MRDGYACKCEYFVTQNNVADFVQVDLGSIVTVGNFRVDAPALSSHFRDIQVYLSNLTDFQEQDKYWFYSGSIAARGRLKYIRPEATRIAGRYLTFKNTGPYYIGICELEVVGTTM